MTGFYSCHKTDEKFYMIFGGRCLKIRDVCMDFEPNFKVHNFISFFFFFFFFFFI